MNHSNTQSQQQPSPPNRRRRRPQKKQIRRRRRIDGTEMLLWVLWLALMVRESRGRSMLTTSTSPPLVHMGVRRKVGRPGIYQVSSDMDVPRARAAFMSSRRQQDAFGLAEDAFLRPDDEEDEDEEENDEEMLAVSRTKWIRPPKRTTTTSSLLQQEAMDPTTGVDRGGDATARPLVFWENMVCGAVSRSIAQTIMHPANTMKTILQSYRGPDNRPTIFSLLQPSSFRRLTYGAGTNFLLSVPNGAVNFATLEFVRSRMGRLVESVPALRQRAASIGPALDFTSSAISTVCCSVVATPQFMITDNIMAGNYPNLPAAVRGLAQKAGLRGFYLGWWPGIVGKIPSYALTWTFFQQLKVAQRSIFGRPPKDFENSIMGAMASATSVCIMIPMDTIKTRLVTQAATGGGVSGMAAVPYKGIIDCAVRSYREEGIGVFYRGLPPRLISVVPMIAIQFGVYEFMKKVMVQRSIDKKRQKQLHHQQQLSVETTTMMSTDVDNVDPYPAAARRHDTFQRTRRRRW